MPSSDYWKNRYQLIEESGNKDSQILYDDLQRQYIKAQRDIENQINTWYQRFATNNQITMNEAKRYLTTKEFAEFKWDVKEYIKYGEENALNPKWMKELENASARFHISRLEALKLQTQQTIEVLYGNQLDQVDSLMKNIYTKGYNHSIYEIQKGFNVGWNVSSINENQLQKVISKPWSSDGKTFSENIWGRKNQLVNEVHTQLTQTLIQGKAPDDAIKAIAKKFGNGQKDKGMLYNAGRLIMTESAYFANLSQRDCFKDLDVEQYEIVATLDSITSSICRGFDGKKVDLADFEPNVTAPPFHCWCRTIIVPYFNDAFDIGKRAARGKDGKTYFVPDNMTYEEWERTFVDGDSKTTGGLKEITDNVIIKDANEIEKLKESIITKNIGVFQTEDQKIEFEDILSNHGVKELNLYNKLSDKFNNNIYNKQGGAAYYPSEKVVKMNINNNDWERSVGNGKTGSWHTKFHEEFHQLDHILSQSKFANLSDGQLMKYNNKFTNGNTVIGQKIIESIDNDVLSVINKSIDWLNDNDGLNIKHLKNIDRISRDSYLATIKYLKYNYDTPKLRAQIAIFTDAMGLSTKNRINPHGNGFWGHDATYNKERGKNGASSETWATFGSLIYAGDEETISVVKSLMPETWSTLISVFDELLEYTLTNDIEY